jgi:hypothetical protein
MLSDYLQPARQSVLLPEEVETLQRVFDQTCNTLGIQKKSAQAEGLAATLVSLYERGIQTEGQLTAMVDKIDFL